MSGSNLLKEGLNETALVATAYANKNGETMFLQNDKYSAYFSWSQPWVSRVPDEIRLERTDYKATLQELFPDAFDRYFESLTIIE